MNVMAQAHKNTKLFFQAQPMSSFTYAQVFRDYLKQAHKEYKAMTNTVKASEIKATCMSDTAATDFVIEGTAIDSEGGLVHIGFSSGNEAAAQSEAEYYLTQGNGFTKVDIYLVMHYVNKGPKEFKIVK